MADIDDAFDQLYSSPEQFMQTYYFKLTGAYDPPNSPNPKTSGLSIFRFSEIEYCPMTLNGHAVEGYEATVLRDNPGRALQSGKAGNVNWLEFRAYYCAMKKAGTGLNGGAPGGSYFSLPPDGDYELMITSQLSGCTFGIGNQVQGGACTVSHLEPADASPTGNILMQQQTHALHGDNVNVMFQHSLRGGGGQGYDERAHVVGKRGPNGIWHFWAQRFKGGLVREIEGVDTLC